MCVYYGSSFSFNPSSPYTQLYQRLSSTAVRALGCWVFWAFPTLQGCQCKALAKDSRTSAFLNHEHKTRSGGNGDVEVIGRPANLYGGCLVTRWLPP